MDYLEKVRQSILDSMRAAEQRGTVNNTLDFLKGAGRAYSADIAGTPVDLRNMASSVLSPEGGGNPYAQAIRNLIGRPDDKYSSDYFADKMGIGGEGLAYNAGNMIGPEGIKSLFKNALSPNVRKIFAGEKAANAPLKDLDTAKEMTKSGADPRQIWKDTGWFQGRDGNWRWEIDDSQWDSPEIKLGTTLSSPYPAYNEQYPDKLISITGNTTQNSDAFFSPYSSTITIDPTKNNTKDKQKNSMLHEYQHAIQENEGFTPGKNLKYAQNEFDSWRDNLLNQLRELEKVAYTGPNPIKKYTPENLSNIDKAQKIREMLRKARKVAKHNDYYWNSLGEVEARAVSKRMGYSPQQRRDIFPEDDYDTENALPYRIGGLASLKRRK